MTFYFNRQHVAASDLLNWPPLRVYAKDIKTKLLPVAELVYLESDRSYTWLQWADGRRVLLSYTLKTLHERLPPVWFIRLHRNCIVNRRFIDRIEVSEKGPQVHLTTGMVFPISRRQWASLRKEINLE